MIDLSSLLVADRGQKARLIHLVDQDSFEGWAKSRPPEDRALLEAHRFDGKTGFAYAILPRGNDFSIAIDTLTEKGCLQHKAPLVVPAVHRLPIIILYSTVWYSKDGSIRFYDDVYKRF